ncbi:hypothetical protein VPH35_080573 [Triticum aestivum]
MTPTGATAALVLAVLTLAHHASLAAATSPRVIIVGAGMSGISAGKRLLEAGITDLVILEATDHVGGRMHKRDFGGIRVEMGANWVEGVNGGEMNPIWPIVNSTVKLTNFRSDFDHLASNVYKEKGGVYKKHTCRRELTCRTRWKRAARNTLPSCISAARMTCQSDLAKRAGPARHGTASIMSILAMQRLNDHLPNGPSAAVDMILDYFKYDYEFAEPPRVTSLQNTIPLATFSDFGDDVYFHLAGQYLRADKSGDIVDPRLQLNKIFVAMHCRWCERSPTPEVAYKADYVMVSTSLGVLQSDLIKFKPLLPTWKVLSIYQFDMAVYTKIFVKFPKKFWPEGKGREFFLYASSRRGYYGVWQEFEAQYPDANVLLVTVTDEESRRIEQQSDNQTKAEIMEVLRSMFPGEDVPDATDILVPRWWSDRFYKGTFSNWPIGVNRYEYDQLRAPVGRVYFTGEHTSEHYNGYVHGAYLSGIDSADILINCAQKSMCKYHVQGKYD